MSVIGRVMAKRESSSKLFFYDIHGDNSRLQVMASQRGYDGADHFASVNELLKRGDIVRIEGFPCRTKVGELSIAPSRIDLITPCLHHLPEQDTLKNPVRRLLSKASSRCANARVTSTGAPLQAPLRGSAHQSRREAPVRRPLEGDQLHPHIFDFAPLHGGGDAHLVALRRSVARPLTAMQHATSARYPLTPLLGGANARPFVAHSNALSTDLYVRATHSLQRPHD